MSNLPVNSKILALLAMSIFFGSLLLQNAYGTGHTAVRTIAVVISNVGYFAFAVIGGVTVLSAGSKWLKNKRAKKRENQSPS